jgi:hypothetical protein
LRELINRQAPQYKTSTTKEQKGVIITEIVQTVIATSPTNSGFIKQDKESGRWFFIGMEKAKDKIGHALRKASQRQSKTNKPVAEKTTKQEPPETIFDREPQHDLLSIASHDTSSPCTPSLSSESWPVDINHNPTNDELQTRNDDSFYHPQHQHHQHHPYYYPPNAYSYYPQYPHYPPSTYHYPPPTTTSTPFVSHKNEQPLNVYTSYEEV